MSYSDNKLEEWQRLWMEKWSAPLPAQIVAMCRIVRCDICEAAFNSGIMARSAVSCNTWQIEILLSIFI